MATSTTNGNGVHAATADSSSKQQQHPHAAQSPTGAPVMSQAIASAERSAILAAHFPRRFFAQPLTPHMLSLHARIRNAQTSRQDFVFYADQLLRHLIEYAVAQLVYVPSAVTTPTGHTFNGCTLTQQLCAVSILRAGESMESALRSVVRGVSIGKILIQRDESVPSKPARLYYSKVSALFNSC